VATLTCKQLAASVLSGKVPEGLKSAIVLLRFGTAEAVPFQNNEFFRSL
jgi:hypothetical protein